MTFGSIPLTLNGEQRQAYSDENVALALVLRNEFGLRGVRVGCSIGECGACTVVVGGVPVRSCNTPLESVAGQVVLTPEGLGSPEDPGPVQLAFLEEQAGQCGYCINGIMMTVAALAATESPDRRDVVAALDDHICRCGTHARIIGAACRSLDIEGVPSPQSVEARPLPVADGAARPPATIPVGMRVEDRLRLRADGTIEALPGKVELGQGIRTALAQVVAANLGLPVEQVHVAAVRTGTSPDEGFTSGSMSLEQGGVRLAAAAVAFRRLLLDRAATIMGIPAPMLSLDDDGAVSPDGERVSYDALAELGPVTGDVRADDLPTWSEGGLGTPRSRDDLLPKLTGSPAYVHDLAPPGMVHARVLLPPRYDARLTSWDPGPVRTMPGVLDVIRDGRLLLVIAEEEHEAIRAVTRLTRLTSWDGGELPAEEDWLGAEAFDRHVRREDELPDGPTAGRHLHASYAKPYEAHASVAPSCAVAVERDGVLHVVTHSQGVYPLRAELAILLGLDEEHVVVEHADGPGCYGHNAADDAAAFAAIAARRVPGRPVRFVFGVEDEFAWEPYSSAMSMEQEAWLDPTGAILAWRNLVRSDLHDTRPRGSGDRLVPAWLRASPALLARTAGGSLAARNGVPPYDIPSVDMRAEYAAGPLRTSALRSLGAYPNLFAVESFMDELAELAGADPLEFRLRHLSDERTREVLLALTERAGWQRRVGPSGRGLGIAVGRYKDVAAYAAVAVDVEVDVDVGDIHVTRIVVVADAGGVVNPDGLHNQLQGGALQGLSRALHEEVRFDSGGVLSRDWRGYPVLRFSETPVVDVLVLDRPGEPPLGAGECVTPLVPAALANAVDDRVGIRVRSLPLTSDRLRERLETMNEGEVARVRL